MTAGRDLHDINTVLHPVGHWDELNYTTQNYAAHRLRLAGCTILRSAGCGRVFGRGTGLLDLVPTSEEQSGPATPSQGFGESLHTAFRGAGQEGVNPEAQQYSSWAEGEDEGLPTTPTLTALFDQTL
jgi:hypothetical protein